MLSEKMLERLNEHLNVELHAGYKYLSMAAYCHSINMNGAARWLRMQGTEELQHAMKFYDYINDKGGKVSLLQIDEPKQDFESLVSVFELSLKSEQDVTAAINALVELSFEERDFATQSFLQWFVTEQIEEEATVSEILESIKMIGDDGPGLFLIDRELGTRQESSE